MLSMIFSIILLVILILLIYDYYRHHGRKDGRLIDRIPGPPIYPILGNVLDFQLPSENLWLFIRTLTKQYYPIVKIWLCFKPIVNIRHPDDMETILSSTKHIEKSDMYTAIRIWLGTGLLTSGGAKWQTRRKILTPAFHFNILRQFVDVLVKEGECMTKSLKDADGPVVKDLLSLISEHTLNAICETAMGTSLRDFGTCQQKYRKAVEQIGQHIIYRLKKPWTQNMLFALTPMGWKQARTLKVLHGFTEKIIAERKLYHEQTGGQYLKVFTNDAISQEYEEDTMKSRKKQLAMLDLLIANSPETHMSDLDIREEVDTFVFEGHDTTAMAICFSLMLLAEHKDIQERVRMEVHSVMEETKGKLNMTSLQRLPYLERCLKESLRLYPSVPIISRITAHDVKLQSYVVPSGSIVTLDIFGLHRDPNFWPDPKRFDPDRFLPENVANRHTFSYIPFSAGSRNCIGQRFAFLEMKAIIAPLLHNFYLEPVDYLKDVRLLSDLVIRTAHPIRIRFVPIDRACVSI